MSDLQTNQEAIRSGIMSNSEHDNFLVAKGRYLTLGDMLGLQSFLESARANLEEQESDDASL